MNLLILIYLLFTVGALAVWLPRALASSYRPMPANWHAPRPWLYEAWCLHDGIKRDARGRELYRVTLHGRPMMGEGAWNAATGNGYEGGLQFLLSTWLRAGGVTVGGHWASIVSPREQLYRTRIIWNANGGSFAEWGDMRVACGLR
jgi:hypothetical protein